jgi:spermidine/putrescine transport system ATP-binding protein
MAAGIELVGLTKRFGHGVTSHAAVDNIDLSVSGGEFFSLLGPSGCGKTTTLRLIAGFEEPTAGRILLDGADVSHVPPHKRNVNTVFQSYALFPFLSVFDNVAFGLKHASVTKAEQRQRVGDALSLVSMSDFAARRPSQLSGGQQQRVALARALVLNPEALLLDEPLGALDAKLRRSLKVELKALQERVGITFIYVTHDQEEALTMSDRIAVMNAGRIAQIGTPQEVYESPADAYVADFLGAANLLQIVVTERVRGGASTLKLGDIALTTSNEVPAEPGPVSAGTVAPAVIRPERVRVEEHGSGGANRVPALVDRVVYLGAATQVHLRLATGESLQAVVPNEDAAAWSQGTPVHVYLPADALRVLAGDAEPAPVDAEAAVAS